MSKVYIAVDKTTAKVIGVYPTQQAARSAAGRHVAGLFDASFYTITPLPGGRHGEHLHARGA